MQTTVQFLDAVKARHGLTSDYQLARKLGITTASVSTLRARKACLGDETALKVAALLELSPGYVLACAAAERSKSDALRRAWRELAGRAAAIAVLTVAVALLAPEVVPVAQAAAVPCVLCQIAIAIALLCTLLARSKHPNNNTNGCPDETPQRMV